MRVVRPYDDLGLWTQGGLSARPESQPYGCPEGSRMKPVPETSRDNTSLHFSPSGHFVPRKRTRPGQLGRHVWPDLRRGAAFPSTDRLPRFRNSCSVQSWRRSHKLGYPRQSFQSKNNDILRGARHLGRPYPRNPAQLGSRRASCRDPIRRTQRVANGGAHCNFATSPRNRARQRCATSKRETSENRQGHRWRPCPRLSNRTYWFTRYASGQSASTATALNPFSAIRRLVI